MDCSPPGSSVHGISQVRLLECIAISLSRGSSQPRDQTCISCIGKRILYHWAMGEAQYLESYNVIPWFPPSIYTFPSHYLLRKLTNTHKPSASILRLQAFQGSFSANQNPLFFLRIPYILPWLPASQFNLTMRAIFLPLLYLLHWSLLSFSSNTFTCTSIKIHYLSLDMIWQLQFGET